MKTNEELLSKIDEIDLFAGSAAIAVTQLQKQMWTNAMLNSDITALEEIEQKYKEIAKQLSIAAEKAEDEMRTIRYQIK